MTGDKALNNPPAATDRRGDIPAGTPLLVDQAFDGDSLYALRATLEAHATEAGLPEGRAGDLVITVHELATNAVLHGAGAGRVRVWGHARALHCQVSDDGTPRTDVQPAEKWPYEHGHGLWIARYLSDRFAVSSGPGGTTATVTFALPANDHSDSFRLVRHSRNTHVVLSLAGDLDQRAAHEVGAAVRALLSENPAPRLILDLTAVTFWDAIGIAALVTAQQRIDETSAGAMFLVGLSEEFKKRLAALSPTPFTFSDTPDDAVQHLPPPS
ncbi:ATP-binding protein [Nonomuraea sp. NPDC049152]|uniref:ATP-binding protein n=1 Tax=Nonomuraea sp. NPDC049152 TaxID=3154350 RepID=UPI0033E4DD3B